MRALHIGARMRTQQPCQPLCSLRIDLAAPCSVSASCVADNARSQAAELTDQVLAQDQVP
eukprot:3601254-Rhodomonas_salina.1